MRFFLLSLIIFFLMSLVFKMLFLSVGIRIDISGLALFYTLYRITMYVNIIPGNLGLRELMYGVLGEQLNAGMLESMIVSILLRIFSYIALFTIAIYCQGVDILKRRQYLNKFEKG